MTLAFDPPVTIGPGDALVVVDVQRDFLPGGALAVPEGDAVIAPLNRCLAEWQARGLPIFLTRDWHPPDHCSFRAQGGPWPPHCVAGTEGAAFDPRLVVPASAAVVSKAATPGRAASRWSCCATRSGPSRCTRATAAARRRRWRGSAPRSCASARAPKSLRA